MFFPFYWFSSFCKHLIIIFCLVNRSHSVTFASPRNSHLCYELSLPRSFSGHNFPQYQSARPFPFELLLDNDSNTKLTYIALVSQPHCYASTTVSQSSFSANFLWISWRLMAASSILDWQLLPVSQALSVAIPLRPFPAISFGQALFSTRFIKCSLQYVKIIAYVHTISEPYFYAFSYRLYQHHHSAKPLSVLVFY